MSALTQMYLDQNDPLTAISVFTESLKEDPSLAHSGQLLESVCLAMEKIKASQDMYTVMKFLMDQGISVCMR